MGRLFTPQDISPRECIDFLESVGAANIKVLKDHFKCDSKSVRKVVGKLLYHDKVIFVAYKGGVWWMTNRNEKGWPSVKGRIAEATGTSVKRRTETKRSKHPPKLKYPRRDEDPILKGRRSSTGAVYKTRADGTLDVGLKDPFGE